MGHPRLGGTPRLPRRDPLLCDHHVDRSGHGHNRRPGLPAGRPTQLGSQGRHQRDATENHYRQHEPAISPTFRFVGRDQRTHGWRAPGSARAIRGRSCLLVSPGGAFVRVHSRLGMLVWIGGPAVGGALVGARPGRAKGNQLVFRWVPGEVVHDPIATGDADLGRDWTAPALITTSMLRRCTAGAFDLDRTSRLASASSRELWSRARSVACARAGTFPPARSREGPTNRRWVG